MKNLIFISSFSNVDKTIQDIIKNTFKREIDELNKIIKKSKNTLLNKNLNILTDFIN